MCLLRVGGKGFSINRKAVIHRDDFDAAGFEIFYRMIGAMVSLRHLAGLPTQREPEHLMTEADAEDGNALVEQCADGRDCVAARRRGIAGAV